MLNRQLLGSTLENKNLMPLLSDRISHVFKLFFDPCTEMIAEKSY